VAEYRSRRTSPPGHPTCLSKLKARIVGDGNVVVERTVGLEHGIPGSIATPFLECSRRSLLSVAQKDLEYLIDLDENTARVKRLQECSKNSQNVY